MMARSISEDCWQSPTSVSAGSLLSSDGNVSVISNKFLVGDPLTRNAAQHLTEPSSIIIFPFIEPKRLFDNKGVQMERFDGDIGSLDHALKQRPKVFEAIHVDKTIYTRRRDRPSDGCIPFQDRDSRHARQ